MKLPPRLRSPGVFAAVVLLLLGVPISIGVLGTPRFHPGGTRWSVEFSHPGSLRAGQTVAWGARFRNDTCEDVRLSAIEFGPGITQGIEILGSRPPWSRASRLPDGSLRAEFDLPLDDGEALALEFDARAVGPGEFAGAIRTRFDREQRCDSLDIRFAVDP
jgi:hypothetical protein